MTINKMQKRGKKEKNWCLKRYPKNDVTTGGKICKEHRSAGGQEEGKPARCGEVAREDAINNMVASRRH